MKIRDAKVKTNSGGYERLFNDKDLGLIFSKVQATVISNGSELERILLKKCQLVVDLNDFIDKAEVGEISNSVWVCTKRVLKNSKYKLDHHEPDLLIFVVQKRRVCKIIELKDGDSFDTKKSLSEYQSLKQFAEHIGPKIPFTVEFYICCFNQLDKQKIIDGFKNKFEIEHVMTGKELCDVLSIDYQELINIRKQDAIDNLDELATLISNHPKLCDLITKKIKNK